MPQVSITRYPISRLPSESRFIFIYCYESYFMSNFHYAKNLNLFYLEDKFNDTFRYPDDKFTIDNPEFEKQLPDIYPAEFQLNKVNTSDIET